MDKITILHGDNMDLLKSLADNSIDSIVTDSPYGFGKEPDALKLIQAWATTGYMEIKGGGFMGKKWDAFVPQPAFWKEVYRVLKPGGHGVSFFGTRTYDWGTLAIRLAGFEIRDMITWHYGSGFPKSLDVSKAIDKYYGEERKVTGIKIYPDGTKGHFAKGNVYGDVKEGLKMNTEAYSKDAKKYDGWGSALKPATEPICVFRKPLSGTIARNMIEYGTGGINIDACRIEFQSDEDKQSATFGTGTSIIGGNYVGSTVKDGRKNIEANNKGWFPANVIFDDFMATELDKKTGILKSGQPIGIRKANNNIYGQYAPGQDITGYGDEGGASRFFYVAKPSREERDCGLHGLHGGFKNGSGKGLGGGYENVIVKNFHTTVKPIALMRYLIRLITPVGGICVDPFAGSGTTGCAAAFEDCDIILMEAESEYMPLIELRTKYWQDAANRKRYIQELNDSQMTLF